MNKKQILLSTLILGITSNIATGMDKNRQEELNKKFLENFKVTYYRTAMQALNHGADVNTQNEEGNTVLHLISNRSLNDQEIFIAQKLIEKGINLNTQNKYGNTAAHNAAWQCNLDILRIIHENDGDLTIKNNNKQTPLDGAEISLKNEKEYLKDYEKEYKKTPSHMLQAISDCQLTVDFLKEIQK